jgi:hypothetical protein
MAAGWGASQRHCFEETALPLNSASLWANHQRVGGFGIDIVN